MSNPAERQNFAQYLNEARSWETSRLLEMQRSRRAAWVVAGASTTIAAIAVFAVAGLTPLKQTELKVLRVNNTTGLVDIVSELPDAKSSYGEAVNKYFAQLYIRYRESYSKMLAPEYYYSVGLMSESAEQRRYFDWFNPKNPLSPLNVYGENGQVRVQVKSVSFVKADVALIRYTKEVERGAGERPTVTHWAATMAFKYSGAAMSERDRSISPLGFQVTDYRNDPDTVINESSAQLSPLAPQGSQISTVPESVPSVHPSASRAAVGQVPAIRIVQ